MTINLTHLERVKNIQGIAFEGGGMLGNAHVGAIKELLKYIKSPKQITHFAGASAGSFVAAAMANGASVNFMENMIMDTDFNKFKDDSWGFLLDIIRLDKEYGWYKGRYMEKWYQNILKKLTGSKDITFAKSYKKYGTYLVIPVTKVYKDYAETIYCDSEKTPNMPIWKAVTRSARIPIYFKAAFVKGIPCVDGGTYDNYPIAQLYKKLPKDKVLGLKLMTTTELYDKKHPQHKKPPTGFFEFIDVLISTMHDRALKIHIHKDDWKRTIKINVHNYSSTNFNMTNEEEENLLKWGEEGVKGYIEKKEK